jgi:GLPGLI family protein
MKTLVTILVVTILLVVAKGNAQEFKGKAIYKSHRKVDLKMDDNDQNSEINKQIQEQLRKQFQQEYTLTFDRYQSLYKKNEKLATPAPASNGIQITVNAGSDLLYKNIKENRYVNQTEIYGKQFLIKDSLKTKNWILVNETKNIGTYTCFKATFSETYETQTITDKGELEKVTKDRVTTVWYTPQIPINNGPEDFHGLPGLILEINDGELTLVCTRVVINPDESIEIKEPKSGKEVSQTKFDEIMDKKTEEMMENMRPSRGEGKSTFIRIGG